MPQENWNEMFPLPTEQAVREFCEAANRGDIDAVSGFLNIYGIRIIDEQDHINARAITWAAYSGHTDVVNLLLEKGADIDAGGTGGKPALSWAAEMSRKETAALLLEKGASLEVKDDSGNTPIELAHKSDEPGIVALFEGHLEKLRDIEDRKKEAERQRAENIFADAHISKLRKLPRLPKL